MSKAFTPPDTMSQDDILRVADVRRAVWTGGFKGLAVGLSVGFGGFWGARVALPTNLFPLKYRQGKYWMLCTLVGGAVCSQIGATTAGKNTVHTITDVFQRGARPLLTEYQETQIGASSSEEESMRRRAVAIEEARRRQQQEQQERENSRRSY
jgi:hypothetical protein